MTSAQQINDQELAQFGWVESIATNSISDFKSSRESLVEQTTYEKTSNPVSYTHLRAHETVLDLVCRLLLEKKK